MSKSSIQQKTWIPIFRSYVLPWRNWELHISQLGWLGGWGNPLFQGQCALIRKSWSWWDDTILTNLVLQYLLCGIRFSKQIKFWRMQRRFRVFTKKAQEFQKIHKSHKSSASTLCLVESFSNMQIFKQGVVVVIWLILWSYNICDHLYWNQRRLTKLMEADGFCIFAYKKRWARGILWGWGFGWGLVSGADTGQ